MIHQQLFYHVMCSCCILPFAILISGFGGLYGTKSKYGDMDITGDGAVEFFTNRIKITSKWPVPTVPEYTMGLEQQDHKASGGGATESIDHANFAGRM